MTDGIEKFEVTDWDLENEFNPNRVKHHLTKKQQIYGVFASDESDEEERPSFGRKGTGPAFPTSVNFISGGVRTVGENAEKKKESDNERGSSDEEVPKVAPKKSFSNQRSGLSGNRKAHQIAGLRSLQRNATNDEFGGWEKHTKGIGQKLLLQMGYEPGKGLGKKLQGITTPIEAKLRKGKGAIGLYGPEQPTMARASGPGVTPATENEEVEVKKHQRQWKKKTGEGQLKVKYAYKTADEVVQEGAGKRFRGDISSLSSVKVIDMTGPEQRILSGYHQIHQQHSKPPELEEEEESEKNRSKGYHFSLPELEHNLRLLEDDEKQKIIRCDRQKQIAEDKIVNMEHEKKRLAKVLVQEGKQMRTLEKVLEIVQSLDSNSQNEDSNTTLEIAAKTFKDLQDEYYEEYKMYNLSDLAITIVVPLVKKLLMDWIPFSQKHHCIDIFQDWKALLEADSNTVAWNKGCDQELAPYHRLVWDVWMPPVRKAILSWNARNWSPLVELLDSWMPLLPPWIMSNILEQLVLPRLQTEVEAWNPLTDTLPVHSWLHPWLPLMGARLESLYAPIRQKLASALVNWHPSDCSAKLILEPWRPVFAQGIMDAFVISNIVPKLAMALQAYVINPHQQHLDVWNWVMAWQDMIPDACMVTLLEKNFFPKWLQVLYTWLTHSPNYEEVTKWYTGWKSMLPPSLATHPIIKEQFRQALDIMNRAVSAPQGLLGQQPGAKESMAYLTNVERQQELDRHVKPRRDYDAMLQTIRAPTSTASLTSSFKDLIEKKAQESNILFMPVAGRYQEGKQVHRFGSNILYLDRGVIFVFNQKTWVPTSLQSLLDTAG